MPEEKLLADFSQRIQAYAADSGIPGQPMETSIYQNRFYIIIFIHKYATFHIEPPANIAPQSWRSPGSAFSACRTFWWW